MTETKSNYFTQWQSILMIAVIWVAWSVLHGFMLQSTGFSIAYSVADSAIFNAFNIPVIAVLYFILRYYQPTRSNLFYLIAWNILLSLLVVSSFFQAIKYFFAEQYEMHATILNSTYLLRVAYETLLLTIFSFSIWMWNILSERRLTDIRKQKIEKIAREAELNNLRMQLQPHFLFNSLNSISALAGTDTVQARTMIEQLSDFLRATLRQSHQQFNTLEVELHQLQLYFDIEKVRFGNRLKVNFESDETTLQMKMPSLLLQPLAENAIKFGLYGNTGNVTISICAKKENNLLIIDIRNPYDEKTTKHASAGGTGFGIEWVRRRLALIYSRHDLLSTHTSATDEATYFNVTVKVPQP